VSTAPRYTDVERAIRSVPGVAEASIVEGSDSGRGRLRIRLHPGEDPERVSWSVAATLRERFGIALDPDEIRPRAQGAPEGNGHEGGEPAEVTGPDQQPRGPGPNPGVWHASDPPVRYPGTRQVADAGDADADRGVRGVDNGLVVEEVADLPPPVDVPAAAASDAPAAAASDVAVETPTAPARAVIRDLRSHTGTDGVVVTATLDLAGRLAEGRSMGVPTTRGLLRTIAEATVLALGELTGERLRAQIERVSLAGSDPTTVTVVVTLRSTRGEELLLGASIVRDDVEHAVMRATLDALNRRVERDLTA
jgi:hypothetical protein